MFLHPFCLNEEGSVLHHTLLWYGPVAGTLLLYMCGGEWEGVTLNDSFVPYGQIRQKLTLCVHGTWKYMCVQYIVHLCTCSVYVVYMLACMCAALCSHVRNHFPEVDTA